MLEKLRELGIRDELIREITEYRETYPVEQEYGSRIRNWNNFTMEKKSGSRQLPQFCVERIFCWQVRKQRERVCLQRIWREYLQDHGGMCRFM